MGLDRPEVLEDKVDRLLESVGGITEDMQEEIEVLQRDVLEMRAERVDPRPALEALGRQQEELASSQRQLMQELTQRWTLDKNRTHAQITALRQSVQALQVQQAVTDGRLSELDTKGRGRIARWIRSLRTTGT